MTLLEFFFIISGIIILIISIDIAKKQKFNALHFLIFIGVWWGLLLLAFFPGFLNFIAKLFWVARWADVLVYASIIFLLYFVLLLLTKHVENKEDITSLVRNIAIDNANKKELKGEVVFLIPCYNEWEVIKNTINNIFHNGYENIIVVNDWSKDGSKSILSWFWDKIILLNHYKNRWQWAALQTGFEFIKNYLDVKYIVTFDADGQHDINDLNKFIDEFKNNDNLEIVLGSRFLKNNHNNKIPFTRKVILKLGVLFTYFISNIKLTDTHNGYRLIKKSTLDKIKITQDGMTHASEIIDIISSKKISFSEVPVNIKYTDYSLAKWQSSWNAINIALRIIWSKFFR